MKKIILMGIFISSLMTSLIAHPVIIIDKIIIEEVIIKEIIIKIPSEDGMAHEQEGSAS